MGSDSTWHYQLAFIDLNMPVMTRLELVKILRSQHIQPKISAISAYADDHKKLKRLTPDLIII